MRSLRARWSFILIAVITNLGGGPMAWAHLAANGGHCHVLPAPTVQQSSNDCPEHQAAAREHARPAPSLPCCDGGSCACAAPPAPVTPSLGEPGELRHDTAIAPLPSRDAAPDPLDDSLRPPIR
jgi:hypothetical protein